MSDGALREHLRKLLAWGDAHVDFDRAVAGLAPELRGVRPEGLPYSSWELLEHLRITQHDILEFSRNPEYAELSWPEDYWPDSPAPPDAGAWDRSVAAFRADREALQAMAADAQTDLFARIPHGQGQTYLREILLAADHAAYHVGQLVLVRRLLGAWD
ncbi:MAG: DinB family protein [Longimicrobiaceae bacterium]